MNTVDAMDVIVVVVTRNRRYELLRSLPRQAAPVALVDNGSDDGTAMAVCRALPAVRVLEPPHNRGAAARTIGVRLASTPYSAHADDDSWWARVIAACGGSLRGPFPHGIARGSHPGRIGECPGPQLPSDGPIRAGPCSRSARTVVAGIPGLVALDLAEAGWGLAYVDEVVVHHHPSLSRDRPDERRMAIARSKLLTAVLRRPWGRVLSETRHQLRSGPSGRAAALAALPRMPAALRARRCTSDAVERNLNRLRSSDSRESSFVYGSPPRGIRIID